MLWPASTAHDGRPTEVTTTADPWFGSDVAGYRIDSLVGQGGMGVVYLAWDERLKRHVAVKLISPELSASEQFRERFLVESELAASLEHPNVVPVHAAGEMDGHLYLVMRRVEGGDLKTLLREHAPLPPERALAICGQLAEALDAAHARGLVHRDVKPSNVLVDAGDHVYLSDFGLTCDLADAAAFAGDSRSLGTPAYVAPEQIRGDISGGAADQYALACVLFECLTGETPFPRRRDLAVLYAHLDESPPRANERNRALPGAIDAVLERALAKNPDERYVSCAALISDARGAFGIDAPVVVRDQRPLLLVAVGALVVLVALATALLLAQGSDPDPELAGATDTLIRIDPGSGVVGARYKVGPGANAVAVGLGHAWVSSVLDSTVWRIDTSTGAVRRIQGFLEPQGLALASLTGRDADTTVLVADMRGVGTVDPGSGVASGPQDGPIGFVPLLATGELGPWAAGSGWVGRVVGSGYAWAQVANAIPVRPEPHGDRQLSSYGGLAVGADAVWLTGGLLEHALFRVFPKERRVRRTPLPAASSAVALGGSAVWVASPTEDVVWRVDPGSGRVTETIPVGRGPSGLAFGSGALWVALSIDGTVQRIDPERRSVVDTVRVGGVPSAVAVGAESVWVTSRAG